jgi:hypothetical protein
MTPKIDQSVVPRELTTDEVRDIFTQHVDTLIHYWATLQAEQGNSPQQEMVRRLEGVAHSIFATLDGCSLVCPGFIVAPMGRESDQQYHREQGENWFPYNSGLGIQGDIGGDLRYWLRSRKNGQQG